MNIDKVVIILTPGLIIDPALNHYVIKDDDFYGIVRVDPSLFYNYSTLILERNNLLLEKLRNHYFFKRFKS